MKRLIWILPCLGIALANPVLANPFHSSLVCVPKINPGKSPLEFEIRESASCQEGEALMQVHHPSDGSILLLHYEKPLEPEQQEMLRDFKQYHGIK